MIGMAQLASHRANAATGNYDVSVCHERGVRYMRTHVNVENVQNPIDVCGMVKKRPIGMILSQMRAKSGLSLDEVAKRAGYKGRSSVQRYFSEDYEAEALPPKVAANLGEAFKNSPISKNEILELAKLGAIGGALTSNSNGSMKLPDMVEIGEIDLSFGLGAQVMDQEITAHQLDTHEFPLSWLRSITNAHPSELVWAKGQGDSMEPRISDGDIILIDRSKKTANFGDLYWAIAYGNTAMVKRLRPMADGSVKILSDNPNVPDEVAWDGELNLFGRVVAVVKNI